MKQIKIKQEFLNYIKDGIKTFEIRKDPNLDGIVELVVKENEIIKDSLIVNLTKTDMSTYEIGKLINWAIYFKFGNSNKHIIYYDMLSELDDFLIEYSKDNKTLYWYDLEIVKE